ncbi:MAG: hypothetical protein KDI00_08220, partial [Pseudomonadales bacterium]|nr:hypothetical protein [Pseudomonadales bacterium]
MTATHWQQYKGQIGLWAMVLAVLWWWPEESTSKYSSSEPFIELSSVDVVTVQQTRIAHDIAVTGTIAPVRQTILNARVLGEVKQVSVR